MGELKRVAKEKEKKRRSGKFKVEKQISASLLCSSGSLLPVEATSMLTPHYHHCIHHPYTTYQQLEQPDLSEVERRGGREKGFAQQGDEGR